MQLVVTIDYSKCTGCRTCELACSLTHIGECNPDRSRISIVITEEAGDFNFFPVTCMQCEKPTCELVCPTNAITKDPQTGAMIISAQKCIGCSCCSYACPFGACYVDRTLRRSVVCDQCKGDPLCVKLCPTGALRYVSADKVNTSLKIRGVQRLINNSRVNR